MGKVRPEITMKTLLTLTLWFCAWTAAPAQAAEKPNFVVVFMDDMGYADLSCSAPRPSPPPTSTAWPRRPCTAPE